MTGYRSCLDCPAPVKFRDRVRCHVCHRRVTRAALKRRCPRCGQLRHLGGSGSCAQCARAATRGRPAKTITCARCGEQRRNAWHGLCNRCSLADPDRPFRYAAAMSGRLDPVPAWWDDLTAFAAARHHPGGAIVILREAGRLLAADPAASPQQLLDRCAPASGTAGRALRRFFTSRGLALPGDDEQRRAAARRHRYLDAVPAGLAAAVGGFNRCQLQERERARRGGRRPLSDTTVETRLRILRDLAIHLASARLVTGWSQVTTTDLEGFLGHSPSGNLHQRTYVLAASSAGRNAASSSSSTRPRPCGWAASRASTATSLMPPSSGHCSGDGPTTPPTRTNGSSACSRCCTPPPTPSSAA